MSRKTRIDASGALHHIIVCGIERRYHYQANGYDFDWLVEAE